MRILILTYGYKDKMGIPNYPDTIKALNPQTWIINYQELYYELGHEGFHDSIRELISREHIDVLFCFLAVDFEIHVNFLAELRKKVFVVLYFGDDCTYYDMHFKYVCQGADYIFTNIIFAAYKYIELGVPAQFLAAAFDVNRIKPMNFERDIDVSFVGLMNNRFGRAHYIEFLKKNGIEVETWGQGTRNGVASPEKKLELYCRSKINLDFTGLGEYTIYTLDYPLFKRKKHPKGRSLEIALTKSFLLSENAPGIEAYLTPGKEIDVFNNENELLEKVRYYLAHPEEREWFAGNAYVRAQKKNNLFKQCQEVLNIVESKMNEKNVKLYNVFLGKDYNRNYATYRFYCFLRFMKLRKFQNAIQEISLWMAQPRFSVIQGMFFLGINFPLVHRLRKRIQSIITKTYKD